jgi:hypothetical protein
MKTNQTEDPPNVLRLAPDGTLFCIDNQDVKVYLRNWAKKRNLTPESPINLIQRDALMQIVTDAYLLHHWGA